MVYLLKFNSPIGSGKKYVQYYLGYCEDDRFEERMDLHATGRGARLTQVAKERGIGFTVARTWPNLTRQDERRMKNRKRHASLLKGK